MSDYTEIGPLEDVKTVIQATCPNCGVTGTIYREQFIGKVPVSCPECEYDEAHDYRDEVNIDRN